MQVDVQTDAQADVRAGTDAVMYNPFEPGFAEDPYPQYAAIRADGRVHHNPLGLRVLSHYDDCFELLRLGGHQRRRAQRHEHRASRPCPTTWPSARASAAARS